MSKRNKVWAILILVLVIFLSAFLTSTAISKKIDRDQRVEILKEAQQASLLAPYSSIEKLSASPADLQNTVYINLKQSLMLFRSFNPSVRFVYVLGYKPEIKTQFFYVDSEPENSSDYSAPGSLFPDTREKDIESYLSAKPYTDGPYNDSWGEWVSGYAPILDKEGNIVALLGIDTATSVWHQQIGFVRTTVYLIAALLSVIVVFIVFLIHRKQSSIDLLEKENTTLVHKQGKMKEIEEMARIGSISIYFPSQTFLFDGQVASTLDISDSDRLEKDSVLNLVHVDDKEKIESMLREVVETKNIYTWVDARLGSREKGFRLYHIYGNIERDENLAPKKFSGIIQDITDIHS